EQLALASGAASEVARLTAEIPREVHLAFRRRTAAEEAWRRYEREALPATAAARDLLERGLDAGYLSLPDVLVQQDRLLQVRRAARCLARPPRGGRGRPRGDRDGVAVSRRLVPIALLVAACGSGAPPAERKASAPSTVPGVETDVVGTDTVRDVVVAFGAVAA